MAQTDSSMKAAVYTGYGSADVVQIRDVAKPVPNDSEVLIRVRAASVNPLDWRLMRGKPCILRVMFGLRKPKIRPGRDVAGEVEAVGDNVQQFKPGDPVFGVCKGAFAEYACAAESRLAIKPASITFDQAAGVPVAAFTALQGLRDKGHIQPGQRVLINGASGGAGTLAVQIAKSYGTEVTGVCSARNVEMVRSIGADHVVDYTQEDFTISGQRYDLILDCVGNHSLSAFKRALNPSGTCVIAGAPKTVSLIGVLALWAAALMWSRFDSRTYVMFIAKSSQEYLTTMRELIEAGKVTPVIDRRYALGDVPEAIRYLEQGHARGKVVISLETQ